MTMLSRMEQPNVALKDEETALKYTTVDTVVQTGWNAIFR